MIKWTVEYTVCVGAMSYHEEYYKCRAFTPYGAWVRFKLATINEDHYADRTRLNSFFHMMQYISLGWNHPNDN